MNQATKATAPEAVALTPDREKYNHFVKKANKLTAQIDRLLTLRDHYDNEAAKYWCEDFDDWYNS